MFTEQIRNTIDRLDLLEMNTQPLRPTASQRLHTAIRSHAINMLMDNTTDSVSETSATSNLSDYPSSSDTSSGQTSTEPEVSPTGTTDSVRGESNGSNNPSDSSNSSTNSENTTMDAAVPTVESPTEHEDPMDATANTDEVEEAIRGLGLLREPYGLGSGFLQAPIEPQYNPDWSDWGLLGRCFVCNDTGALGETCRTCGVAAAEYTEGGGRGE